MPSFVYQARDASGERVAGTREAASQQDALQALREAGLFVTKLLPSDSKEARLLFPGGIPAAQSTPPVNASNGSTPSISEVRPPTAPIARTPALPRKATSTPSSEAQLETPQSVPAQFESEREERASTPPLPTQGVVLPSQALPPIPKRFQFRASTKELSLFWSQMHSMLEAGVAISHAMTTMAENAPGGGLRAACREMAPRISAGTPLSELMKSYPGIFSELAIGMIKAGEMGGFLDRMCLQLSQYAERDYNVQQTIKRETWYPKLVLFASIIIPAMPPVAVAIFTGKPVLPVAIACFLGMLPSFLIVGAVWALWKSNNLLLPIAARTGGIRYAIDQVKLLIPIAGKTARALATAKFCRSLGALQSAGTGVQTTIHLAANACGNAVIAENARRIIPRIEAGEGMTEALASTRQLPAIAIQMLRTGEATGNFDVQLDKAADFLEQDAETTIKQSVAMLGVLALVFIGIRVAIQLVQFYSGYFDNIFDTVDQIQK